MISVSPGSMSDRIYRDEGRRASSESGDAEELVRRPQSAYTKKLLDAVPRAGTVERGRDESRCSGMSQTVLSRRGPRRRVSGAHGYVPRGRLGQLQRRTAAATLAIVGESGCGKSTIAKSIVRLLTPTSGRIVVDGIDIAQLSEKALRPFRSRVQMVFQDPYGSLDPHLTAVDIVGEPLAAAGGARQA